jgi:hypothetical protein
MPEFDVRSYPQAAGAVPVVGTVQGPATVGGSFGQYATLAVSGVVGTQVGRAGPVVVEFASRFVPPAVGACIGGVVAEVSQAVHLPAVEGGLAVSFSAAASTALYESMRRKRTEAPSSETSGSTPAQH